jgi:hypothetical protein
MYCISSDRHVSLHSKKNIPSVKVVQDLLFEHHYYTKLQGSTLRGASVALNLQVLTTSMFSLFMVTKKLKLSL